MHIGLIGGIGPAATIAYYDQLVRTLGNAKLPVELTIVHADVAALIANAAANRREEQAEIFAKHIRQLEGAGCDIATITALTGHFCFAETSRISSLPLVSAIDPIDRYCEEHGIKVVGLLGSTTVLQTRLFGQLRSVKVLTPMNQMDELGEVYLEMATSGTCSEETRERFFLAGEEMVNEFGADAVLLAGTDLSLAFDGRNAGYKTIDALSVHVDALVDIARA